MTTATASPLRDLATAGHVFTSAIHLSAPRRTLDIIRSQPGYRRGQRMRLAITVDGGIRLYVSVNGRWMDASLSDISDSLKGKK